MDSLTISMVFIGLVGLVLGILLALIVDGQRWGLRLKTAVSQKRELEENLKTMVGRLKTAETKYKETARQLSVATSQITQLNTEIERLQQQTKTAESSSDATRVNLTRVSDYTEDLLADNQLLRQKLDTAESRHEELQFQITGLLHQLTETQSLRKKLLAAEEKLQTATHQQESIKSRLDLVQRHMDINDKSELVVIKGIGPKLAQRLRDAGIVTLSDLANQTPEQVVLALKLKSWQATDVANWIAEAGKLTAVVKE